MKMFLVAIAAFKILVDGASAYAITPADPVNDKVVTAACPSCLPDPPPPDNC